MKMTILYALIMLLTACAHSTIVSDFNESPDDPPLGEVAPLAKDIGDQNIILIMIHGVGDHCPGYALREGGWINNPIALRHGLTPVKGSLKDRVDIYAAEFMPHRRLDTNSKVSYLKSEYFHEPSGKKVVAIEITWSELTQWIKTQQLGYDMTRPSEKDSDGLEDCFYENSETEDFPASKGPPTRVLINRIVKERTLNRNLSDAVLYVGRYGTTIQRGIAEAVCRSLGGTAHVGSDGKPDGQLCQWPTGSGTPLENSRFVFFTHSLGSRALYDTLLGLSGDKVNPDALVFTNDGSDSEVARSRFAACKIISQTSAVYMMANQLSMLGLAFHDAKKTSEDGPQPYDASNVLPVRGCGHRTSGTEATAQRIDPRTLESIPIVNVFSEIRERARDEEGLPADPLNIVSFNDTNDLLTWGIPRWYANRSAGRTLPIEVTNVFVANDTRWASLFENPGPAHSGYFTNSDVWSVITCGAKEGRVNDCL